MTDSILEQIVENRRKTLENKVWPEDTPSRSEISMADSIRQSKQGIIFECKRKSPSRGLLSEDYHPDKIAQHYSDFAAGISVLTEPDYFAGSDDHLELVRSAVDLPIIAKDFVVDLRQIAQARRLGANCILLMLSVVDNEFWQQAFDYAQQLNMTVLTEVHDELELQRAIELNAPIIGINNRNLHTLTTDLEVTRRLAPKVPSDRIIISESGLATYQDLRSLSAMVHGFLIGTSMMQSGNLSQALRKLLFSEVKICRLTNANDAQAAFDNGASWGGVILTPASKRFQSIDNACEWVHDCEIPLVGVFMNQTIEDILTAVKALPLVAVQLHGDESMEYVSELSALLPKSVAIWKTLTASDSSSDYPSACELSSIIPTWLELGVEKVLIDKPKNRPSDALDFSLLENLEQVMLAGGIGIDSDILKSGTRMAGLDICSGVESQPGIKNQTLLKQLFALLEVKTRND